MSATGRTTGWVICGVRLDRYFIQESFKFSCFFVYQKRGGVYDNLSIIYVPNR